MDDLKWICFFVFFLFLFVVIYEIVGEKIAYIMYDKNGVKITGKIVDMECIREYRQEIHVSVVEYHVEDKIRLLLLTSAKDDEIGKEVSVYKYGDYIFRDSGKKFNLKGVLLGTVIALASLIYLILHWNSEQDGMIFLFGMLAVSFGVISGPESSKMESKRLKKKLGWHDNL